MRNFLASPAEGCANSDPNKPRLAFGRESGFPSPHAMPRSAPAGKHLFALIGNSGRPPLASFYSLLRKRCPRDHQSAFPILQRQHTLTLALPHRGGNFPQRSPHVKTLFEDRDKNIPASIEAQTHYTTGKDPANRLSEALAKACSCQRALFRGGYVTYCR